MNSSSSGRLSRLIFLLSRLPGVGEKTAQRYALFLLTQPEELALVLGREIAKLHELVKPCFRCGNLADVEENDENAESDESTKDKNTRGENKRIYCSICLDSKRDPHLLCIVARVHDLLALEKTQIMRGRYFVLGKLLSPLDGVYTSDLPISKLKELISEEAITEVILATPPSVDGEATALLIKRELSEMSVLVSRIASGVPHGGDLEFADAITLSRALDYRQKW